MEPIAITAATLVAKWAAEGLVKEAAKSAWSGLRHVYDVVKSRLASDDDNTEVLERLTKKPSSEARIAELAEIIESVLKSDPQFHADLRHSIDEAEREPTTKSFVTEVKGHAKVGKITNINSITGSVTF